MNIGQKLDIINISKYYADFKVLHGINMTCLPGEFVTILGSSGSGKTTLLKVIAGFEGNSDGSIHINGEDIAYKKAHERNIGMLFQNYALFPHMTVENNIAYPLKLRKVPKDEIKKRVADMIATVKLTGLEKRYPKQLSGGQQQRVALARAIVYNPPLLLLDEPLGALDMNLRHDMQFEIKRITKELGITTISVTHDQEEAFAMSDKICIMSEGRVQQFATPDEIYEHPSNRFVAEFMGTTNISETPMTLLVDNQYIRKDQTKAIFTLRPESIHLDDGQTEKIDPSVQLEYVMGAEVYSSVISYNTDVYTEETAPQSWADFWNTEKYPGKRAMWQYPVTVLEAALLADGVSLDELYPLDLDRAFKKLDEIKDDIVWWTAGAQPSQMLSTGETDLALAWSGRILTAADEGAPVGLSYNQGLRIAAGWVVPKGAPHKEMAMKFIEYISRGESQAAFSKKILYGSTNNDATALLSEDLQKKIGQADSQMANQTYISNEYWAEHLTEVEERFNAWLVE